MAGQVRWLSTSHSAIVPGWDRQFAKVIFAPVIWTVGRSCRQWVPFGPPVL